MTAAAPISYYDALRVMLFSIAAIGTLPTHHSTAIAPARVIIA